MKNLKFILISLLILCLSASFSCGRASKNPVAKIIVTPDYYEIKTNNSVNITILAKDENDNPVNEDTLNYTVMSTAKDSAVISGRTISFLKAGEFTVEVKANDEIFDSFNITVFEDPIKSVKDRTSISSNISAKIYFQLSHDFNFENYNFNNDYLTDTEAYIAEYTDTYEKFYYGNKDEKDTAVKKLCNDILIRFTAIGPDGEIVLSAKNKAWSGYLNHCPSLYSQEILKLDGENFNRILQASTNDYFSTSINLPQSTYKGYTLRTELNIIENNRVFTEFYDTVIE